MYMAQTYVGVLGYMHICTHEPIHIRGHSNADTLCSVNERANYLHHLHKSTLGPHVFLQIRATAAVNRSDIQHMGIRLGHGQSPQESWHHVKVCPW